VRARKIQDELRLNELAELVFETERTALAGRKKFVGNASVFGERDLCRIIGQAAVTTDNTITSMDSTANSTSNLICSKEGESWTNDITAEEKEVGEQRIDWRTNVHNSELNGRVNISRPPIMNNDDDHPHFNSKIEASFLTNELECTFS